MTGRVIAIGDIHGCAEALERILAAIEPRAHDHLVTLGDVVDRGPDVRRAIDLLLDVATKCRLTPILGNHEEMMLAALKGQCDPEFWLAHGGGATLRSYGFAGRLDAVPRDHQDFIASGVDFVETSTHFLVHANYLPGTTLGEQPGAILRWTRLDEQLPSQHDNGKVAIVGHTAEESGEILSLPHLKCIDTFCYGGKWLTALDVGSGQLWQADYQGRLRKRTNETARGSSPMRACEF